jgi:hypothetical protein
MNAIPGKIHGCLALPFLLAHGVGHDPCTWVPIFLLCYFCHKKDGDVTLSKHQAHTMDGVIVGRSETSNALLVYNPRNKQYNEPDSYCFGSYCLPSSVYPDIKYDDSLFCQLLRDINPQVEEPYPPGTCVEHVDPASGRLFTGTVMDIPFPSSSTDSPSSLCYTVLFDNGTLDSIRLLDMADIIPRPPVANPSSDSQTDSLFRGSSSSIQKSHTSMRGNIIRYTCPRPMASTVSPSNLMLTNRKRNGEFPSIISPLLGLIFVFKVSLFLDMSHIPSSDLPFHLRVPHLILLFHLSVRLIFTVTAHLLFSKLLHITTLIARCGLKVIKRKSMGSEAWTRIGK